MEDKVWIEENGMWRLKEGIWVWREWEHGGQGVGH